MSINTTVGSYVSPQGAYDTYTQGFDPVVVMGTSRGTLDVRCYIDEILIPRLPPPEKLTAQMFIRGTNTKIPLEFVRLQPYVSPKIHGVGDLPAVRLPAACLKFLPFNFTRALSCTSAISRNRRCPAGTAGTTNCFR